MNKYKEIFEEILRIIDSSPNYECEHKDVVYMPLNKHIRCPRCGEIWVSHSFSPTEKREDE